MGISIWRLWQVLLWKKGKNYIVLFNPALPKLTCYFKKFIPWEKENLDNTFSAKLLSEVAIITVVKNEIDSTYFSHIS